MQLFGSFHDACLHEVHLATGHYVEENLSMRADWRTTVLMLFQRQFRDPSAIELRFEEVLGLHVSPPLPNYEAIIFHAAFFVRDGVYYWAESGNWEPGLSAHDETTWVAARKVYWREASNWLGPRLRYNTSVE
jgi:hypothetical protein